MKKSFLLFFCTLLLATTSMSAAELNVYASGLKVTSLQDRKVTISYTLNAPATSLQLQLIQGETITHTFELSGNQLTKGLHKDVLIDLTSVADGNYTWALVASNSTANTQTTKVVGGSGSATRFRFNAPRGLVVDNNPNSPLFGQIYLTESQGATHNNRTTSQGVYVFGADLSDVTKQGDNAFGSTLGWDQGNFGPARLSLDKEGYLYICDNGATTSGVYRFNPITKEFAQTLNTTKRGEIYTRINSAVVTGEGHNKKLWAIDTKTTENGGPAISTHLVRYNIGIDSTNYAGHPDTIANIHDYLQNINNTLVEGLHNDLWIFQYRNGDHSIPVVTHIDAEGQITIPTLLRETSYLRRGSGAISPDGTKLAFNGLNNGNKIRLFDVSYDENKKPTLTETITTIGSAENVDGIAFDVANNLYFVSEENQSLYAYALPKANNTHTTYAPNNQNIMLATPRIMAYNLNMKKVGDNYQFSFYANSPATSATLLFYQGDNINTITHRATFNQTFNKGQNTISIPASEIARMGELHWALQLTGNNNPCFGEVYHQDTTLSRAHAVIDNSPESEFFGRIYISNRKDLTTEKDRGEVYILNNTDYSLIYSGKLKNDQKQDVELGSAARPAVDAEGYVYWADYGDTCSSGVQVMDPKNLTVTQFFQGNKDENGVWKNNSGVPMGSSSPGAHIYGTGANTKLFLLNEDKVEGKLPRNGYLVYNIGQNNGSIRRTWDTVPSQTVQILDSMAGNFSIVGTSHGAFVCQNRTLGHNESRAFSLQFYDNEGNCKYQSRDRSLTINGSFGAGMAVSADESKLVMVNGDGNILLFNIDWAEDDTPKLTLSTTYSTNYAVISTIHFDYAGNLVVTAGTGYAKEGIVNDLRVVIFSQPTDNNTTTIPAPKKQTINSLKGKKVYIDPGHGDLKHNSQKTIPNTIDNSVGAFCESSANLRRSRYLKEKLIAAGVEVAMRREENIDNHPKGWLIGKEVGDNYSDFDYFISIHSNAPNDKLYNDNPLSNYPMIIYRGYSMPNDANQSISYYSPGSYEMAKITWNHIYGLSKSISSLQTPNASVIDSFIVGDLTYYYDPDSIHPDGLHLDQDTLEFNNVEYYSYLGAIRHMVPGFLVEGFHHTYAPARHRALNQDYCNMEGLAYFRGIMEYFGAKPETKGYILGVLKDTTALMQDTMEAKEWGSDLYNFHEGSHDMYMPCNGAIVTLKQGETIIGTDTVDNLWNGIFAFYDLEPGTYTIESEYKGITTKFPAFEVRANETTYQVLYTRESEAQHRIWAYDLRLNSTYQGYTFNFKSVLDSHEGYLILKDGEGNPLATHALPIVNKGANSFSLTFDQMPAELQFNDIYWEVQLSSAPVYPEIPGAVDILREVTTADDKFYYYLPQDVAVDNNPNSEYFGNIYVAEPYQGANNGKSTHSITQTKGIYVYDPLLNLKNYAKGYIPSNVPLNNKDEYRQLHRIAINPVTNDVVFAQSAGAYLWSVDATNLKEGKDATNLLADINNITRSQSLCFDESGTLYVLDNFTTGGGTLYRINDGVANIVAQSTLWGNDRNSIVSDGRGGIWMTQYRAELNDHDMLSHIDAGGEIDFSANKSSSKEITSLLPENTARGHVAYNPAEDILALGGAGKVILYSVTYNNNGPTLTKIMETPEVGTNIDGIAFDYAGDLYVMSASVERFYKFAVPTQDNTCTTPAPESQKISQLLILKDTTNNRDILNTAATRGEQLNVHVTRSLTSGMYNTLCLPFDVATITGTPLEGAEIFTYSHYTSSNDGNDIFLHFDLVDSIKAGTPYLIKPAADVPQEDMTFHDVTITRSTGIGEDDPINAICFNGILSPKMLYKDNENYLFLTAYNRLAWANADANMNGMRAYFYVPNGASKLNARARIVTSSSTTTDLQQTTTTSTNAQKLILNGILYILKDGQLYTVFGTKVK